MALASVLIAGCGSGPTVDRHETYGGPPTVAVNPVTEARAVASPTVSKWWIQKLVTESLDRSGELAGAVALPGPNAENEATVILDLALTELDWQGAGRTSGELSLRVRSRDKASGRSGIDRVYKGRCKGCRIPPGQPPVAGPLADLTSDLARDLARKHGG